LYVIDVNPLSMLESGILAGVVYADYRIMAHHKKFMDPVFGSDKDAFFVLQEGSHG
jgi:hypothetical protein